MSYIIEQTIGKHRYVFECTAYINEDGKPRNKRVSIGKVDPVTGHRVYKPEYIERTSPAKAAKHHIPLTPELRITHLLSISYLDAPYLYPYGPYKQSSWIFHYVNHGTIKVIDSGREFPLKTGEAVFHKPGNVHDILSYEDETANIIIADFICPSPAMKYFENRVFTLTHRECEYLHEAVKFNRYVDNLAEAPFGIINMVQASLEMLLVSIIQRDKDALYKTSTDSYAQMIVASQLSQRLEIYFLKNLNKKLTIEKIATDLGYSVTHLKYLFRKEHQQGVIDFFIDLKMREARRLLQEGVFTISEVSEKLGFCSPTYFSSTFKRRVGTAPNEYGR